MEQVTIPNHDHSKRVMEEARHRVLAGAGWLDQVRPGWEENVSLAELKMGSCERCVAGQVFGDYMDAKVLEPTNKAPLSMREMGLMADHGSVGGVSFEALEHAWTELIVARSTNNPLAEIES